MLQNVVGDLTIFNQTGICQMWQGCQLCHLMTGVKYSFSVTCC